MVNNFRINRRTCLKGLGAALALPLLETMGWADAGKGKAVKPPVRLGFMYMPHGVIMDQFWPANRGELPDRRRRRPWNRCARCSTSAC